MATKNFSGYNNTGLLAQGWINKPRTLEVFVDFTQAANQVAAAADSLQLFRVPKGTVILQAGQEQIVAGTAGSTTTARVGTVAYSGTLASDAAVATAAAHADVAGGHPVTLTADADFNLLVGTAVRADGVVRAWIIVQESAKPVARAAIAARDTSTGLA
jgi:hypothetical protein